MTTTEFLTTGLIGGAQAPASSAFDSRWDRFSAILDEKVDNVLGDRIEYWIDGNPVGGGMISAFVLPFVAGDSFDAQDDTLGTRWRIKVAKSLVAYPDRSHRIRSPKLGEGTFQPSGSEPDDQGRYWLFDVQKA